MFNFFLVNKRAKKDKGSVGVAANTTLWHIDSRNKGELVNLAFDHSQSKLAHNLTMVIWSYGQQYFSFAVAGFVFATYSVTMAMSEQLDQIWLDSSQSQRQPST